MSSDLLSGTLQPGSSGSGMTLHRRRMIFITAAAAAVVIGIVHASSLWYINDDCFVSFRYARNLVRGLGLVYNAEERVEGYTNFLWTMLMAGGMKLHWDPVGFSTTLGIIFGSLTMLATAILSWKLRSGSTSAHTILPVTAIALALHRDFSAHSTSGMETAMFAFFITGSACALLLAHGPRGSFLAGIALTLAMLTRPDGVVFLAAAGIYLIFGRQPVKNLAAMALPVILLFVPYWIWRMAYYGFFFPNTFYAKSVNLSYYTQGLDYVWLYVKTYYIFAIIPVVGIMVIRQRASRGTYRAVADSLRSSGPRPILLSVLYVILYTAFVVRLGGDFMFARFFIATTPMIYLSGELLIGELAASRKIRILLSIILLAGTVYRWNQYDRNLFAGYVADEAQYFTPAEQAQSEADGAMLNRYFSGLPVRVAFWAGGLKLVYYADPPYAMEASGGLTDTAVAHRAITERGRPGHEKQPQPDYFRRRRVHFYFGPVDPPPPGQLVLNAIRFDHLLARILTYDNTVMSRLGEYPGIRFVRMPEYLDRYTASMDTSTATSVAADYAYFREYYFNYNIDTLREMKFRRYLDAHSPSPATEN